MSARVNENQGLLDAALEIAAERANTLRQIRTLLLKGDEQGALQLLRKHLGISNHKLKLVAKQ